MNRLLHEHKKSYKIYICCCYKNDHDALMSVFYFVSTPLSLSMWTYFSISISAWGQARSKLGGVDTSILHHAFYRYLLHYWLLLHVMSQYLWLFSLILQGLSWRGRMPAVGILGWKRSKYWKPILHSSKNPETPRKSFLELIRIIGRRKYQRGPTPWPGGWGRTLPYWARPLSPGPPGGPPVPIFCYMKSSTLEKIISKLTGRNSAATRRNLGGTNLGLRRSCSAGETSSGRGKSSPTILSSGGGQSPSTSSPAPSPLKP